MKQIIKISVIIFLIPFFTNCSKYLTGNHYATVTTPQNISDLSLYEPSGVTSSDHNNIDTNEVELNINNKTPFYLIEHKADSFFTKTQIITPTKVNPVIFLNLIFPIASVAIVIASPEISLIGLLYVGSFYTIADLFWGVTKKYDKEFTLDEMTPYPDPNEKRFNLNIDQIDINIESDKYSWEYYKKHKHYKKEKIEYEGYETDSIFFEDVNLKSDFNQFLAQLNLHDSTRLISGFNRSEIYCEIVEVHSIQINGISKYNVTFNWEFNDAFNKTNTFTTSNTTTSVWKPEVEDEDSRTISRENVLDAGLKSLAQIIDSDDFKTHLGNMKDDVKKPSEDHEILNLPVSEAKPSIPNAVKSCVTVVVGKGHGSGCVVSSDGYIITNSHVIEQAISENDSIVSIIFENGDKKSGKILRDNPFYDLALIKVDTSNVDHFNYNPQETMSVGEEVYAIGTPEDIELGQTITKGIISGKRKVNEVIIYQSDVSINRGNSGGAMINSEGNLIGIVSFKMVGLGVEGIGFSIPVSNFIDALNISNKQ